MVWPYPPENLNGIGHDVHSHIATNAPGHAGKDVQALPVGGIACAGTFVDQRAPLQSA